MSKPILDENGKPLTGGQAYKREDDKYGWRFCIEGNIRYSSDDRWATIAEAEADFVDVSQYRAALEGE